jgi:hypothetical protein
VLRSGLVDSCRRPSSSTRNNSSATATGLSKAPAPPVLGMTGSSARMATSASRAPRGSPGCGCLSLCCCWCCDGRMSEPTVSSLSSFAERSCSRVVTSCPFSPVSRPCFPSPLAAAVQTHTGRLLGAPPASGLEIVCPNKLRSLMLADGGARRSRRQHSESIATSCFRRCSCRCCNHCTSRAALSAILPAAGIDWYGKRAAAKRAIGVWSRISESVEPPPVGPNAHNGGGERSPLRRDSATRSASDSN